MAKSPGNSTTKGAKATSRSSALKTIAAHRGPTAVEDEIYELLTRGITARQIRPGSRIREATLAAKFNVSRARVRRVLQRLAELDVVEFQLNFGAIVSRPTPAEAKAVFQTRRILEIEAVKGVCANGSREKLEALRALVDEEQKAHDHGLAGLTSISSRLHIAVAELCGNHVLAKILDQLVQRCVLIQALYEKPNQRTICLVEEHAQLIELMIEKRTDEAIALMHHHIDNIEDSLDYAGTDIDDRVLASIN